MTTMLVSDLPLPRIGRGKVRDIYAVGDDRVLLLTTDRISAFDVVMAETIPMKGAVLTQISARWFNELEGVVPHHMISADADAIIDEVPALRGHRASLAGRAMLCRRTEVFPIECVIRGYLSGSAWKEYAEAGTLAGEKLAPGLLESAKLEPPIFSPATKAETGHDENITVARMREILGDEVAYTLESMSRAIYRLGEKLSRDQGIIIADTKFEFGRDGDGRIILIDEVMTPDSSRFWAAAAYKPGQPQPSFDKQPLRDYLDAERRAGRRHCRPASWTPPASVIWRPIAVSPAPILRLEERIDDTDGSGNDEFGGGCHHRIFFQVHARTSGYARRRPHASADPGKLARTLPPRLRTADRAASQDCRHLVVQRPAHCFSTSDKIRYGEQAHMHLHVTEPERRHQGIGAEGVRRSVEIYFERLKLKRLFCEPNTFNVPPNRTLQKAGFKYLKTHMTVPGPLNFHQAVTRWVMER